MLEQQSLEVPSETTASFEKQSVHGSNGQAQLVCSMAAHADLQLLAIWGGRAFSVSVRRIFPLLFTKVMNLLLLSG